MPNRDDQDLERVPCPDDMCTGTINHSGVCSYCGRSASGAPPASADDPVLEAPTPSATVGDDDERVPCADDMCTGTINERGLCNYCGKAPARA